MSYIKKDETTLDLLTLGSGSVDHNITVDYCNIFHTFARSITDSGSSDSC
jgi:hypothetical protein